MDVWRCCSYQESGSKNGSRYRKFVFETPIQHDYEAGVEVRSLLPTEQLEEIDGRLAVMDLDPVFRHSICEILG